MLSNVGEPSRATPSIYKVSIFNLIIYKEKDLLIVERDLGKAPPCKAHLTTFFFLLTVLIIIQNTKTIPIQPQERFTAGET